MKAVRYDRFGDAGVMRPGEMPDPAIAANGVLVAVRARSINQIDIRARSGTLGLLVNKHFPKVPGADFAGRVIAVGPAVRDVRPGDAVFGAADPFRGGAFADMVAVPADQIAPIPAGLDEIRAAALPIAGLAALQAVRDLGRVEPGQSVLIHGATGPVGLYAIQIARMLGAQVTAVAGAGLDVARAMGADVLIDYRTDGDGWRQRRFDMILNASGKLPWAAGEALLGPRGRLIEPSPTIPMFIGSKLANLLRRRQHCALATRVNRADLAHLAGLAASGAVQTTIAATFAFDRFAEAFALVERGGVVGKVVVTG